MLPSSFINITLYLFISYLLSNIRFLVIGSYTSYFSSPSYHPLNVYPSFVTSGTFIMLPSSNSSSCIIFPSFIYCTVYFFVLSSIFPYSIISFVTLFSKLYLFLYFLSVYHPLKFSWFIFGSSIFSPSSTFSFLYSFPPRIYTTFWYTSPFAVTFCK